MKDVFVNNSRHSGHVSIDTVVSTDGLQRVKNPYLCGEMNCNLSWILFLMIQCVFVLSYPVGNHQDASIDIRRENNSMSESISDNDNEKIISVRVTSSVAIGRTKIKQPKINRNNSEILSREPLMHSNLTESLTTAQMSDVSENNDTEMITTTIPPELIGANIEFIKQLDAKKKAKDHIHPYELLNKYGHFNVNEEILEESSSTIDEYDDISDIEEIPFARNFPSSSTLNHLDIEKNPSAEISKTEHSQTENKNDANNESNIDTHLDISNDKDAVKNDKPSVSLHSQQKTETSEYDQSLKNSNISIFNQSYDSLAESSFHTAVGVATKNEVKITDELKNAQISSEAVSQQNYFQDFNAKLVPNKRRSRPILTTVSFDVVHDNLQTPVTNNQPAAFIDPTQILREQQNNYQSPKIYSEPAKIYSEPAKFYSEPAKIYSEPAKIYSEPAKIYSEPAKIYSVPAKFYSEPASLHLRPNIAPTIPSWQQHLNRPSDTTTINTTPTSTIVDNPFTTDSPSTGELQTERNYEVDENVSDITNGRNHGSQETTTEQCKDESCKVGYVVEGRQFKKYRVEERTSDGFLVGEYGVVRNEDGDLRGVRYTADGEASPRLIYDALMKFLQLR